MKIRRILAFVIDGLIVFIPFYMLNYVLSLFCNQSIAIGIIAVFSVIFIEILLILKDSFHAHYSIGKRVLKLSIYDYNNTVLQDKKILILRNVLSILLLPISFVTILFFNKSIGDYIYHTSVVYEKEQISFQKAKGVMKKRNIILIILSVFIIWFILFSLGFYQYSKKIDAFMLPQIYESKLLKDNIGDIESVHRNIYDLVHCSEDLGNYISYKIVTKDNKKLKIKFLLEKDSTKIIGCVLNNQVYYY